MFVLQGGVIGVFLIATLTDHCCQLMVRCKYYAIDKIIERETQEHDLDPAQQDAMRTELGRTLGYGDIGRTVFGGWCYHLIQFAVWFTQYTTCMCYFIFIGNTIQHLYSTTPAVMPLYPGDQNRSDTRAVPMLFLPHLFNQQAGIEPSPNTAQTSTDDPLEWQVEVMNATTAWTNTTNVTTTTTTAMPAPYIEPEHVTTAPDLRYIVMFPLGFFILTSLIRKVRLIAPFSTIATIALAIGIVSVFTMIFVGELRIIELHDCTTLFCMFVLNFPCRFRARRRRRARQG